MDTWTYILDAEDRHSFLERIREQQPRALVTNWNNIRSYMDYHYPEFVQNLDVPEFGEFQLHDYPGIQDWVDEYLCGGLEGR